MAWNDVRFKQRLGKLGLAYVLDTQDFERVTTPATAFAHVS